MKLIFCYLSEYYDELSGPCADYQPGQDDLQAFDFIRQFQLDVLEQSYPGVSRVRGSNRMQTAYRLQSDADLQMETRCEYLMFFYLILSVAKT